MNLYCTFHLIRFRLKSFFTFTNRYELNAHRIITRRYTSMNGFTKKEYELRVMYDDPKWVRKIGERLTSYLGSEFFETLIRTVIVVKLYLITCSFLVALVNDLVF